MPNHYAVAVEWAVLTASLVYLVDKVILFTLWWRPILFRPVSKLPFTYEKFPLFNSWTVFADCPHHLEKKKKQPKKKELLLPLSKPCLWYVGWSIDPFFCNFGDTRLRAPLMASVTVFKDVYLLYASPQQVHWFASGKVNLICEARRFKLVFD